MERYQQFRTKTISCPSCGYPQKVRWDARDLFAQQHCLGCGELVRFYPPEYGLKTVRPKGATWESRKEAEQRD